MTTTTFSQGDVDHLAATLDAISVDLDDNERATLHPIFALAGKAVADQNDDEVSGFSFSIAMVPGGTLIGSFAPGGDAGNPLTANSNAVLTESIRFGNNPPAN